MASVSDKASATQFLDHADMTENAQALFDLDLAEMGFVMNSSRLWAYQPEVLATLFSLMSQVGLGAADQVPGTGHPRGRLRLRHSVIPTARWPGEPSSRRRPMRTCGRVLRGDDGALTEAERAMAAWARRIARDPNGTRTEDVQELRDAGFSDADIFAITVYVALRIALSTVNDALGARPDAEFQTLAPAPVREAVTYSRPMDASPAVPVAAQQPRGQGG